VIRDRSIPAWRRLDPHARALRGKVLRSLLTINRAGLDFVVVAPQLAREPQEAA
jgi:hypothetical protein